MAGTALAYRRFLEPGCWVLAGRSPRPPRPPRRSSHRPWAGGAVSRLTALTSWLPEENSAGSLPLVSVSLFTPLTAAEMAPYMKRLSRGQTVEGEFGNLAPAGQKTAGSLPGCRRSRAVSSWSGGREGLRGKMQGLEAGTGYSAGGLAGQQAADSRRSGTPGAEGHLQKGGLTAGWWGAPQCAGERRAGPLHEHGLSGTPWCWWPPEVGVRLGVSVPVQRGAPGAGCCLAGGVALGGQGQAAGQGGSSADRWPRQTCQTRAAGACTSESLPVNQRLFGVAGLVGLGSQAKSRCFSS